jgi:hypothetical protein
MKTKIALSPDLEDTLLEGLAYLLWLVNILVCVAAVLQIGSIVNALWIVFGGDRYSLSLVNQVYWLLGGFIAFVYVMVLYGNYGECAKRVRRPGKKDTASQPPVLDRGRLAGWSIDSRVITLLQHFTVTTAIPIGTFIVSRVATQIALNISR